MYFIHCALFNSFIIYKKLNIGTKMNFANYMLTLVTEWTSCDINENNISSNDSNLVNISSCTPKNVLPQRWIGGIKMHHLQKIKISGVSKYPRRRCKVCSMKGKRRDTSFIYKFCQVPLCKEKCFIKYHTKEKYY